jgi:hypothetical protein
MQKNNTMNSFYLFSRTSSPRAVDHFFSVDPRGCSHDVLSVDEGYIRLLKRAADPDDITIIEAGSLIDLLSMHSNLAEEFPAVEGVEYAPVNIASFIAEHYPDLQLELPGFQRAHCA